MFTPKGNYIITSPLTHPCTVPSSFPATTSLNEYLRETAGLKGTKVMCKEAGCGCCAVTVTLAPPDSEMLETYSVQSVSMILKSEYGKPSECNL